MCRRGRSFGFGDDSRARPTNACLLLIPSRHDFTNFNAILCRLIVCSLPRHFYRLKHRVDYLANLDAFHFEVWSQQDAMFQHG